MSGKKLQTNVEIYGRSFPRFSRVGVHKKICELLSLHPKGALLDFPAGPGALSWQLSNRGFNVFSTDTQPENFKNPELPIICADLNKTFPFKDNSFNYATFIDGPEHVENVFHCFREFARVLKPGGLFITSIPNYSNIEHRLRMLFFGCSDKSDKLVNQNRPKSKFGNVQYMGHINRPLYPQLKMALELAGFRITGLNKDTVKNKQRLLWPLAFLIMLVSKIGGQKARVERLVHESNSSIVLMGGYTLIVSSVIEKT